MEKKKMNLMLTC